MIKYLKHTMSLDGIEILPVIGLMIFLIIFITVILKVVRMDKKTENHMKNLPLESREETGEPREEHLAMSTSTNTENKMVSYSNKS